ncbi:MAG: TetR/AcrR family transcriptional regulator [Gemmatimonadales bacterium]
MTHVSPSPPQRKRRRDPKGTRERLVRAAVDLFTTIGYHASTTPQIAARAGVAEGTIYRHFSSKEHLLNEVYRAGVRVLAQPLSDVGKHGGCKERLRAVALEWRANVVGDPATVSLVLSHRHDDLLDEDSRREWEQFKTILDTVVASGKSAGEVRPGPAEVWCDVWLELVAFHLLQIAGGRWTPEQPAPNHVLDAAWDAIANRV